MLNKAFSDSLVDKLTLISDLNNLLVLDDYGCSFAAKLNSFFFFLKKYLCFLQNINYWPKKNVFICQKTFFTEKNINKNVKNIYLISQIYFYTENVCVTKKI